MSISSDNFAVLDEHRRWRFVVFFMLYVAQGIPFGLIAVAAAVTMRQVAIADHIARVRELEADD